VTQMGWMYLGLGEPGHGLERREPPHEVGAVPRATRRRWRDRRRGRQLLREPRPAHHPESPRDPRTTRHPPEAAKPDQIKPAVETRHTGKERREQR
jgi:hypothetical protein